MFIWPSPVQHMQRQCRLLTHITPPCSHLICRSVFEVVGGTCGSTLVLAVPGALLISYASQKAAESRRLLDGPSLAAGGVRQPLLGAAAVGAGAAAAEDAAEQGAGGGGCGSGDAPARQPPAALPQRPYTVLSSKMFWAGVALQLLAAFVLVLTVWRALA